MTSATSITLTLSGNTSVLEANFYPEIELSNDRISNSYSCCLLDFHTYNSIPNVHERNNKFYYKYNIDVDDQVFEDSCCLLDFHSAYDSNPNVNESNVKFYYKYNKDDFQVFEIPIGSYELNDLAVLLNKYFETKNIKFELKPNKNTLKCVIECDPKLIIDFEQSNSLGPLLGFNQRILNISDFINDDVINKQPIKNISHLVYEGDEPCKITHIEFIRIECDLVSGSFLNGHSMHTLHEFYPRVNPGYKITEQPKNLIYLPINRRRINTINISIVDQCGRPVDFRGENIVCRIHIKKD